MEYVIDAKPEMKDIDKKSFLKIKDKIENNIEITNDEKSLFLDYYIKVAREILADYLNVDILLDPLVNRCDLAQNIIGKLLESVNNVIVFPKETQQVIYPTCLGHSFLICIIQNNSYLVDLTYRQFFLQKNCSVDNFMTKEKKH